MKKSLLLFLLLPLFKIAFSQNQDRVEDSLMLVLKVSREDTAKVNVLNTLSRIFMNKEDCEPALSYANDALVLAEKINFKKGTSVAYINIGSAYAKQENFDSAIKNYLIALKICEEIKFKTGIIACNITIGGIYTQVKNYTQALKYYSDNMKIGNESNDKKVVANTYGAFGDISSTQDNYPNAMKNYLAALKIFEEIDDKKGISDTYNAVGCVFYNQGNVAEALKNCNIGLKIAEEINYKGAIVRIHNNIAAFYRAQGNYPEAIKHQLAAIKVNEMLGNKRSLVIFYNNLADYYMRIGKNTEAENYIKKSLRLALEVGDKRGLPLAYITYGELCMQMRRLTEARNYLNKGLMLAKEARPNDILRDCYNDLSKLDSLSGDFKSSNQYLRIYMRMKDSTVSAESNKMVSQLKIQYETEKKNKEIEIKNIKIDQQRSAIWYMGGGFFLLVVFALVYFRLYNQKKRTTFKHQVLGIEMKALRSQMNPHFTFNVLNSIQYYVGGNDMKSAELYLNKFSSLIRMILDQSRNAYITLEQEINTLKLYIELEEMLFENKFEYRINVDDFISPERILIPGMLIQPIVENAIKHGIAHKKGEAMIIVSFSMNDMALVCKVSDNGIGRMAAEKVGVATTHKSMATDIIKERIEVLSSMYNILFSYKTEDFFNNEGVAEGTCVTIKIPFKNLELDSMYV